MSKKDKRKKKKKEGFKSMEQILLDYEVDEEGDNYISREFQDYGYRLAMELDDEEHKGLYIKLAKEEDRALLERARSFVKDADHARSKARLFMWKLKKLREKKKEG